MTIIAMALKNIVRQKKRSGLLVGAISVCVLLALLLNGFTDGATASMRKRLMSMIGGHIFLSGSTNIGGLAVPVVRDMSGAQTVLDKYGEQIESVRYRTQTSGSAIFTTRSEDLTLTGIAEDEIATIFESVTFTEGSPEQLLEVENGVILTKSVVDKLNLPLNERFNISFTTVTANETVEPFILVGVIEDLSEFNLSPSYVNIRYLNRGVGLEPDEYQSAVVTLKNDSGVDSVTEGMRREFHAMEQLNDRDIAILFPEQNASGTGGGVRVIAGGGMMMGRGRGGGPGMMGRGVESADFSGTLYSLRNVNEMMAPIMQTIDLLRAISAGVFLMLIVIVGAGLMNTFRMVLLERFREIGTLRAIGMHRPAVRSLFLFEALFISVIGTAVGLLVSLIASALLRNLTFNLGGGSARMLEMFLDAGRLPIAITPMTVLLIDGVIVLVTLLAAYLPSRKAARMNVADALREN